MAVNWLNQISPVLRPVTDGLSHTDHRRTAADYLCPKRIIYDHEMILYQGSRFMIETEEEQIVLEPDSFVILPPGLLHTEINIGKRIGHRYWCHFDWTYMPYHEKTPFMTIMPGTPIFGLYRQPPDFVPKGILRGKLDQPDKAYALARQLARLMSHEGEAACLHARGILLQLLTSQLERNDFGASGSAGDSLASQIRKRLDRTIGKNISITNLPLLLRDLEYSYEHLSRTFRATYGISPMQYIRSQQISRAQLLLRNTEQPVAQIGYQIGFNSPAYFTKAFREVVGQTPKAYRCKTH